MKSIEELKAEIARLQAEIDRISREGRVLTDCWIASAKPGSKKHKYPRLKSRRPIFDGKKTEYLSIHGSALAEAEAAIARGRQIKGLTKQIKTLNERLEQRNTSKKQPKPAHPSSQRRYPPPDYIDLARQLMGAIDLDPASDPIAQQWVQAAASYSLEQDGLLHPWFGRVWLCPPAPGRTGKWTKKAIAEYELKHITEAILLVKAAPGSKWFRKLIQLFPACFPNEQICFLDEQGNPQPTPERGNAFFYLGQNLERFKRVFGAIGSVSSPV